jgi:hypothetical protein
MAAHASTRTTQLYDRREDRVTLDEGREDQYSRVGRRPTLRSTQQKYPEKPTQSLQRGSRQLCAKSRTRRLQIISVNVLFVALENHAHSV